MSNIDPDWVVAGLIALVGTFNVIVHLRLWSRASKHIISHEVAINAHERVLRTLVRDYHERHGVMVIERDEEMKED